MVDHAAVAEAEFIAEEGYDANDPEQVNKARVKAGRNKKKTLEVVGALMEHPASREWMYMLLVACDVFRTSYSIAEPDKAMAFREGKRFIGLQLLSDMRKASPPKFNMMMDECEGKKLPPLFPPNGIIE